MTEKEKRQQALTEQLLKNFEKNLGAEYQKAYNQMKNVIYRYIDKYAIDGKLSRTEMYKYDRYQKLQTQLMHEIKNLKLINAPQISSYLADQYALNYFYTGYLLETEYQVRLAYSNLNRADISRGVLTPMSKISLKNNKAAIQQKIQSSVIQSIAQGEGVRDLTARIKKDLENNANNALRIARTETTRVCNAAKQDSYEHAAKMGLKLKKRWVASLDSRTRDSHALLDGETVDMDEPFSNGLMYPGDQSGPPEEVINCRCTLITVVDGYEDAYEYRRACGTDGENEIIPDTTYQEWMKARVK